MHGGWSSVKVRDKEQQLQIRKLVSLAFHISLYFETEIFFLDLTSRPDVDIVIVLYLFIY